ncbi:MAG TPA: glycerol-3-phosphate dehydrogenase [Burkholderiales bacterium]|nr:glycerol-3-phosphate dehydrogenase [Burkholderiales bacterium]
MGNWTGDSPVYDVLVVGGGINGAGIARDAAGRGLSALLCEQDDLAAHTSSASTKLIHGGLRYLERFEFGLVRKSLQEREVLLRAAPHIIRPLSFVMPHNPRLRPAWMIRAGLFLYDHLGKRELLPASQGIDLRTHAAGQPLKSGVAKGFLYSDAWVDDARLVVLNAIDAAERGATVLPRTRCASARRYADIWDVTLQPMDGGEARVVRSRALVNAAGPWVTNFLHEALGKTPSRGMRLAKGSHIIVRRLFEHDHAYLFQNPDGRILFAIPYERDFTLIGTTDLEYEGDPANAAISNEEISYLCEMANGYFARPVIPEDVVWTYSGVRPLLADAAANLSAVTRDYLLESDATSQRAPLVSIYGGKLTTYRRLAEDTLASLAQSLPHMKGPWTADASLPGGDIAGADFDGFLAGFRRSVPWLPEALSRRYARAYGTRVTRLLAGAGSLADLGEDLGGGLYEREIDYLVSQEWASTAEDILWRRTKLGLHVEADTAKKLAAHLSR